MRAGRARLHYVEREDPDDGRPDRAARPSCLAELQRRIRSTDPRSSCGDRSSGHASPKDRLQQESNDVKLLGNHLAPRDPVSVAWTSGYVAHLAQKHQPTQQRAGAEG